jgi:hypothetical protein
MIFEKIGAVQLDKDLQCVKIQIDSKVFLIGLQDLEQALKDNLVIGVFQKAESPIQQETTKRIENNELKS